MAVVNQNRMVKDHKIGGIPRPTPDGFCSAHLHLPISYSLKPLARVSLVVEKIIESHMSSLPLFVYVFL